MVECDQQPLIGKGARDQSSEESQAITQARFRIGRACVAKNGGARAAAFGNALDELHGLVDPAWIEYRARMQEHQPGRTCLTCTCRHCFRTRSIAGDKAASGDISDPLDHVASAAI